VYATVADLRAEGVTPARASDERLAHLIDEASVFIDRLTGWWFEPRALELTVSGRGTPTLELLAPPIRLDSMLVDRRVARTDAGELLIIGAPVRSGAVEPRITRRHGVFPMGVGNVVLDGVFGYTEPDGTPEGRTPLAIRRATMLLVLRLLPLVGDASSATEAWDRWRVVAEITRDQSIRYSPIAESLLVDAALDPEVAALVRRYQRPIGLGAA
jgi:hypothetical protein